MPEPGGKGKLSAADGGHAPLADPREVARRQALLEAAHVAPLAAFARRLAAARPGTIVPLPDPCDGGTDARLLLLLEKPGAGMATGFVSRDNPSATAAAIGAFAGTAGIRREDMLLWNVVPWWNGSARVRADEVAAGAAALSDLLALLPCLRAAVTVGRVAARAWRRCGRDDIPSFASAHPSGQVRAAFPARWAEIPAVWEEAWRAATR